MEDAKISAENTAQNGADHPFITGPFKPLHDQEKVNWAFLWGGPVSR